MGVFRALLIVMLLAGAACFAIYGLSGRMRYRVYGVRLVGGSLVAGLVFFAVLIVQRLIESR